MNESTAPDKTKPADEQTSPEDPSLRQRMTRQYYAALQGSAFATVGHWVIVRFFNNMLTPVYRGVDRVLSLFHLNKKDNEHDVDTQSRKDAGLYRKENGYSEKAKFICDGLIIQNTLGLIGNVLGQAMFNKKNGREPDTAKHVFGWVTGMGAQLLLAEGIDRFGEDQRGELTNLLADKLMPFVGGSNPDGTPRDKSDRMEAARGLAYGLEMNAASTLALPWVNEAAQSFFHEHFRAGKENSKQAA